MAVHRLSASAPYISIRFAEQRRQTTDVALIDTGASMSAISPAVIASLNPIVIGSIDYKRIGLIEERVPTYYVRFILDEQTEMAVEAIAIPPSSPCQMLIGRDLMSRWLMTWDGPADRLIISY